MGFSALTIPNSTTYLAFLIEMYMQSIRTTGIGDFVFLSLFISTNRLLHIFTVDISPTTWVESLILMGASS